LRRGESGVPGENPLRARERTNNKLDPHMESKPGFEPGPHWWEASALTTALLEELIYCHCGDLLPLLMVFTLLIILLVKLGTLYLRTLEWSPLWLVLNV